MQPVQNTDDTLFQRRTTHDTVINNHQIIFVRNKTSVSNVVYVCCQIIAGVTFGNERTQLDIFNSHLFTTDTLGKNLFQFAVTGFMSQCFDPLYLQLVQIIVKTFQHTIEGYFGRIGNK